MKVAAIANRLRVSGSAQSLYDSTGEIAFERPAIGE